MTTAQEYQDYRDKLSEHLYKLQDSYQKKPCRLKLLLAYRLLRDLNDPIPEWVLEGLDNYLGAIIDRESRKRTRRTDSMSFIDYAIIKGSPDSVQAKLDYAERNSCTCKDPEKTLDKVNKRMRKWKKILKKKN